MSLHMTLYKNRAENERLDKSSYLSGGIPMSGTLRQETSVIHPTIRIESSVNISDYNYCEITEFKRKYFIKDIVSVRNNIWDVSMECDVLYTYMTGIGDCKGIINKAEQDDKYNKMFNDGSFPTAEDELVLIKEFPNQLVNYDENDKPIPVWMICLTV